MWNIHWNIRGTQGAKEWGFYDPSDINLDQQFVSEYWTYIYAYFFLHQFIYYAVYAIFWNYIKQNQYPSLLMTQLEQGVWVKEVCEKYGTLPAMFVFFLKQFTGLHAFNLVFMLAFFSEIWHVLQAVAF